jgi:hypothetical protein
MQGVGIPAGRVAAWLIYEKKELSHFGLTPFFIGAPKG